MSADDTPGRVAATLAGIRTIEQAATKGPWEATGIDGSDIWSDAKGGFIGEMFGNVADAEFIAEARIRMPLLLAAVEAALKEADRLDTGRGDYGHLVNRHEAAAVFRRAITAALTGTQPSEDEGHG